MCRSRSSTWVASALGMLVVLTSVSCTPDFPDLPELLGGENGRGPSTQASTTKPAATPNVTIQVAFRLDDYSAVSPTNREIALFDVFRRQGCTLTVGVIPDVAQVEVHSAATQPLVPLNEQKAAILRDGIDEGTLEIALHGLSHQNQMPDGCCTEFDGLPYDRQYERINTGRQMLEATVGRPVDMFIPPWNSYDTTTMVVLEDLGFKYFSAMLPDEAHDEHKLTCVSSNGHLGAVRSNIRHARAVGDTAPMIVLFHLDDLRPTTGPNATDPLADLDSLLSWLKGQPNIRLTSLRQIGEARAAASQAASQSTP